MVEGASSVSPASVEKLLGLFFLRALRDYQSGRRAVIGEALTSLHNLLYGTAVTAPTDPTDLLIELLDEAVALRDGINHLYNDVTGASCSGARYGLSQMVQRLQQQAVAGFGTDAVLRDIFCQLYPSHDVPQTTIELRAKILQAIAARRPA